MSFYNKYAIVTGGSSGIGKAIVIKLIEKGVHVYILGRDKNKIEEIKRYSDKYEKFINFYEGDISNENDIYDFVKNIPPSFNKIDYLINSAGAFHFGSIEDTDISVLDYIYNVNFRAPFLLAKLLLQQLKKSKGQVLFINSSAGLKARGLISHYCSSKFALKALADSLRDEVNQCGVKVISIFPGKTASPMQEKMHSYKGKEYKRKKLLQPLDIASTVISLFETSDTAEITDIYIRPFKK